MVKNDPLRVPPEYIRSTPIHEGPERCLLHLSPEIPVIDLSKLRKGSTEELRKLDMACKDWGYFQLVNYGVEEQLLQGMKDATVHFLKQPLYEKQKYTMPMENMQGYGHLQVHNEEHKRDWSDSLLLLTHPTQCRDLSFWPKTPERYKELTDIFSSKVNQVGVELLHYLSVLLAMNKDVLLELHKEPQVYFDVNYYPPCNQPDRVLAMSTHSDENTLTMVLQDQNDATALQIKYKGGWVPVTPKPNALICNIGDIIEIWSNGKYKSVEHRVVTSKTKVRSVHEVFMLPGPNVYIEPLNHLINARSPKLYHKIRVGDYANVYSNGEKQGRSQIERIMIK
ncbi:hypothetical protein RIF29_24182 [Crotalaria pallida]|uniref:Fe2OG dioxygenase domain-containing protein n=1 Tax=Crotalaria pallida TaxID=3830 RepID=A0AAN9ELQ6_CROPI